MLVEHINQRADSDLESVTKLASIVLLRFKYKAPHGVN